MNISDYFFPLVNISGAKIPEKFTFPFYYEPSEIATEAANELQKFLDESDLKLKHNFGLDSTREDLAIGKMFGVLIVQNPQGKLGYLRAFSGKLANTNQIKGFVPPVFDMLIENSYFREGEILLNNYTLQIAAFEKDSNIKVLQKLFTDFKSDVKNEIETLKIEIRKGKNERKIIRESILKDDVENENLLENLRKQSIKEQYHLKDLIKLRKEEIAIREVQINALQNKLDFLKNERAAKSLALQKRLFSEYSFLNFKGKTKSLHKIFDVDSNGFPPSGAGECAAPKLLQFAYQHNLKPLALAEFWWGLSPNSEIRLHKNYYPACRGKCQPILTHMLDGLNVDPNPIIEPAIFENDFEIIYEDDYILAINKPPDFLSVPGKVLKDSVQTRMEKKYDGEIFLVHRLDMATSGILLMAKKQGIHKELQRQFIKRLVKKKYIAILDGVIEKMTGSISLPLRVDLEDRPRQLVCYEHGKNAETAWEIIKILNAKTWINFYPKTGRTHQLRVHAAHKLGLNSPIMGDDLYGKKADRLYLHAEELEFTHPKTKEKIILKAPNNF